MQSRSKPLDDIGNLMTNAVGALKGVGDEVKAAGRARAERLIADMDLVGRDEFELFKDMVLAMKAENRDLVEQVAALKKKNTSLQRQVTALKKQISE